MKVAGKETEAATGSGMSALREPWRTCVATK